MEQPEKKSNSFFRKMVEASRVHKRTRIHIGFRISTCFVVRLSFEFFDGRFSNGEFILLSSIHTLACTQKWYVRWLDQLDTFFNKKMESRQDRWQNSLFFMCVCVWVTSSNEKHFFNGHNLINEWWWSLCNRTTVQMFKCSFHFISIRSDWIHFTVLLSNTHKKADFLIELKVELEWCIEKATLMAK